LTLADLQSEYENWLRTHRLTVRQDKLKLIDPLSGCEIKANDQTLEFAIKFNPVTLKEADHRSVAKSEPSPLLIF
jgi:hypothetical protein